MMVTSSSEHSNSIEHSFVEDVDVTSLNVYHSREVHFYRFEKYVKLVPRWLTLLIVYLESRWLNKSLSLLFAIINDHFVLG